MLKEWKKWTLFPASQFTDVLLFSYYFCEFGKMFADQSDRSGKLYLVLLSIQGNKIPLKETVYFALN